MKKIPLPRSLWQKGWLVLLIATCHPWNVQTYAARPSIGQQQEKIRVTGKVTDEAGQPLPGVTVVEKGTLTGAVTDGKGMFSLLVAPDAMLVFSLIGMEKREIPVNGNAVVNATLAGTSVRLNEIVAVGYGNQSRATLTTSISKVSEEEFKHAPGANPLLQLQSKVPGLTLQIGNGQPGASPDVFIRGGTTTSPNADAPLIIVDGIVSQGMRSLQDMNPDDIESVEVLKDAASTAIYGARAANGIIMVKTKTGRSGKLAVNFRYTFGIEQQAKRLDLLNAREYVELTRRNTALFNKSNPDFFLTGGRYGMSTGNPRNSNNTLEFLDVYTLEYGQEYVHHLLNNEGWETMPDPVTGKDLIFKNTDYQDVTFKNGIKQEVDVDISGGTDKATYYFGLGYLDQDGIVRGTKYKNYSALFNGTFRLTDRFSLNSKVAYQVRESNAPNNYDWVLSRSVLMPPTYRLYYENGLPAPGEGISSFRSRIHEIYYKTNYNDTKVYRTTLQLGADWDLAPGLRFSPSVYYFTAQGIENRFEAYNETVTNRPASAAHNMDRHFQFDGVLTYNKQIRKHHLDAVLGTSYNSDYSYRLSASGREALTDHIPTLNATSDLTQRATSGKSYDALLSYFGRVSYDFDRKYIFSASIREDGSSRFSDDRKWGFFPGVSAGWNIHREDFFQGLSSVISQLKVRSSWGKTGNNSLSIFDSRGQYESGFTYMGEVGILNTTLPNTMLVWESTTAFDAGIDIGFFDGRLSLLVDYYSKLTDNRLFDRPLWSSTGFPNVKSNYGSIRNRGVEVELHAVPVRTAHFSWDLGMTFSYNKGIVVSLPENGEDKNRIGGNFVYDPATKTNVKVGGFAEGEEFGGRWAYHYLGVYQTDEEAANAPRDLNAASRTKIAGDAKFEDRNNDGKLDAADMIYMGSIRPDKMGAMVNTLKYKQLSMRIVLDWAVGHVIDNGLKSNIMGSARNNNNALRDALENSWMQPGDDAKYPRYTVQSDVDYNFRNHQRWDNAIGNSGGGSNNSLYYGKGDFLAFREVSLSYMLRSPLLKKAYISGLEIFGGVYNIGYITAYDGLMPEIYTGRDYGVYPRPRQFNFGLRAGF